MAFVQPLRQGPYHYIHVAANASVANLIPAGKVLHGIQVNNAGSAWTITLFDNTAASGTTIAAINLAVGFYQYDVQLTTGFSYTTAGTTAGDLTILWS